MKAYGFSSGILLNILSTVRTQTLKDKYPNFEVGLKCIIMVF